MQSTQYTTSVASVIAYYAKMIADAAYDSVAEAGDYSITDNCKKIQFILSASANYTSVHMLANACLNAAADTAVCECMYDNLMQYAHATV